jgi:hypothetical protein
MYCCFHSQTDLGNFLQFWWWLCSTSQYVQNRDVINFKLIKEHFGRSRLGFILKRQPWGCVLMFAELQNFISTATYGLGHGSFRFLSQIRIVPYIIICSSVHSNSPWAKSEGGQQSVLKHLSFYYITLSLLGLSTRDSKICVTQTGERWGKQVKIEKLKRPLAEISQTGA